MLGMNWVELGDYNRDFAVNELDVFTTWLGNYYDEDVDFEYDYANGDNIPRAFKVLNTDVKDDIMAEYIQYLLKLIVGFNYAL